MTSGPVSVYQLQNQNIMHAISWFLLCVAAGYICRQHVFITYLSTHNHWQGIHFMRYILETKKVCWIGYCIKYLPLQSDGIRVFIQHYKTKKSFLLRVKHDLSFHLHEVNICKILRRGRDLPTQFIERKIPTWK